MNKFKLAQVAADYAAERWAEAKAILLKEKFICIHSMNYPDFLKFCILAKKEKETFYQPIKRSIEHFNPYFIQIENQRGTTLKVYTFDKFNSFFILKSDLNNKIKRLLKKWKLELCNKYTKNYKG